MFIIVLSRHIQNTMMDFSNTDQCLSLMSCFICQLLYHLQYTLKYNILFSIVNNNTEILANHQWIISTWLYQDIQKFYTVYKVSVTGSGRAVVKNCLWKWLVYRSALLYIFGQHHCSCENRREREYFSHGKCTIVYELMFRDLLNIPPVYPLPISFIGISY